MSTPNSHMNGDGNVTPRQISEMTDREIAEETLFWLRQAGQALAQLQKGGIGAMMSGMMGNMFSKGK